MHVHIHVFMYTWVGVSFWVLIVLDLTDFGFGPPMGGGGAAASQSPFKKRLSPGSQQTPHLRIPAHTHT